MKVACEFLKKILYFITLNLKIVLGRCLPPRAEKILFVSLINLIYLFSFKNDCFGINNILVFTFLNLEVTRM